MKIFISHIVVALSVIFILSSCRTIESRGQYVDDNLLLKLEEKQLTKSEVENILGTPTIVPEYDQSSWYYVQRSLSKRAWFEPKVISQRIVKVTFDKRDKIEEVLVINDSHKDDIKLISEYTKTYGTELNGLQKFVRNIGRFNQTTEGKKKKK